MTSETTTPHEWKRTSLKQIADIRRGASPRPISDEKYFSEKGRGWIRISDVTSSSKYLKQTSQYLSELGVSKSVPVDKGDLIMSICATIGKPIIIDIASCIHDGFVVFRNVSDNINSEFLYYTLQYKETDFVNQKQSGTQGNLNTTIVGNTEVLLPPLPEQHKIASILSKVDEHISQTEAIIEKTEELKRGLMQQLLTKGIGHTKFKKTEIGVIPEEWDVVTVSTIFSVFGGTTPPTKSDEYWVDGNINWVTPADLSKLSGSLLVYTSQRKITEKALKECNLNSMPVDSIIMSTRAPVGYLSLVKKNATFNQGCKGLVPKDNNVSSLFYMYYLLFSNTKLQNLSGGSTFKELGKAALQTLSLPYPPKEEQEKIGQILTHVDDQLSQNQTYLSHLQELKKGLMQDLLTGKVRVTV